MHGQDPAAGGGGGSRIVGEWRATPGMRAMYGLGGGAFAALMAALAIGSVVTAMVGAAPTVAALGAIAYGPIAYASGRTALGSWRARVTINSDGVVVIGPWKTRRVPLEHVEKFAAGRYGMSSAAVNLLRTREGRLRRGYGPRNHTLLWATQRGGSTFADLDKLVASLAPTAAQMNNALARARTLNRQPSEATSKT